MTAENRCGACETAPLPCELCSVRAELACARADQDNKRNELRRRREERLQIVKAVFFAETEEKTLVSTTTIELLGGITNCQDAYRSMERDLAAARAAIVALRPFLVENGERCSSGGVECDELATRRMVDADDMRGCDEHGPAVWPNDKWEELPQALVVRALKAWD